MSPRANALPFEIVCLLSPRLPLPPSRPVPRARPFPRPGDDYKRARSDPTRPDLDPDPTRPDPDPTPTLPDPDRLRFELGGGLDRASGRCRVGRDGEGWKRGWRREDGWWVGWGGGGGGGEMRGWGWGRRVGDKNIFWISSIQDFCTRLLRGESSPDFLTQRLVGSKTLDFHTSSMDFQWIFTGQFWEVRACLIRPTCGG